MKFKDGIKGRNIVVKCAADKLLPFSLVFGLYIILFGTVSPGGGFQGGVMVASGALLLYLGYGYAKTRKVLGPNVLRVNESLGAILYVLLGVVGIVFGANFARNIFFDVGSFGDLLSGGTISFMGWTVGWKVLTGVSFLLLLMFSLLAPDSSEDEEEEEI
ncbi:MAG: MnhB domain-containing protein [Lachnospiraceae bacterium]|nr:MnhB domain-containing protein [Lachnospiraceae bacterium]MBR6271689.1 MnhB domain-containing protein [Lachnospiraceae bacterium]